MLFKEFSGILFLLVGGLMRNMLIGTRVSPAMIIDIGFTTMNLVKSFLNRNEMLHFFCDALESQTP